MRHALVHAVRETSLYLLDLLTAASIFLKLLLDVIVIAVRGSSGGFSSLFKWISRTFALLVWSASKV